MILGAAFMTAWVVGCYLLTIFALEHVENWLIGRYRARRLRRYSQMIYELTHRPPGED